MNVKGLYHLRRVAEERQKLVFIDAYYSRISFRLNQMLIIYWNLLDGFETVEVHESTSQHSRQLGQFLLLWNLIE